MQLFDPNTYPEGFKYGLDFIEETAEQKLLENIEKLNFHEFIFQGYTAKRMVVEYGYEYSFETGQATPTEPIPAWLIPLRDQAAAHFGIDKEKIVQALVTKYPDGSVINWHRDVPTFGQVVGVSLMNNCTFMLRPYRRAKGDRSSLIKLELPPRSVYLLSGEARSDWEHSIRPVEKLRYSITFRTLAETVPLSESLIHLPN